MPGAPGKVKEEGMWINEDIACVLVVTLTPR